MFKKILIGVVLIGLIGALVAGAVIRTASASNVAEGRGPGNGRGGQTGSDEANLDGQGRGRGQGQAGVTGHDTDMNPATLNDTLGPVVAGTLSEAETEGILYMREEEKLAHDVYVKLYETWGLPSFQNIAQSEQTHTEAVNVLIDRYSLNDPANGQAVGVFTNVKLQELYNQLVAEGSQSLADALRVGAAIEEIDILDLEERLAQTDQADIQTVYQDLLKGSGNHLRAFTSNLTRQTGEIYQPQYLSQAAYQAIVGGAIETGGRGRRG
jgi:hypothetical protein